MATNLHFRLEIADQWNGRPCPEKRAALLTLLFSEETLQIDVESPYYGNLAPPGPVGHLPGLWEFEVVELFLAGPSGSYLEVELNPHGHHLALTLDGVRNPTNETVPIQYEAEINEGVWTGSATIPIRAVPEAPLHVNAFAIHNEDGKRYFLAAFPLPGEKPDFHQPHRFPKLADCPSSYPH